MNVAWFPMISFWILICSNILQISEMNLRFLQWLPFVNHGTNWNSAWFPSSASAQGNEEIASKSQGNHEWKIRRKRKRSSKYHKRKSWRNRFEIMSTLILETSPKIVQRTLYPKWSQVSVYRIRPCHDQKHQSDVSIFNCNADCILLQDHEHKSQQLL